MIKKHINKLLYIIATISIMLWLYSQTNDFKIRVRYYYLEKQEQSLMVSLDKSRANVEDLVIKLTSTAIALGKEITILNTSDQKLKSVQLELDNITKLKDLTHRAVNN